MKYINSTHTETCAKQTDTSALSQGQNTDDQHVTLFPGNDVEPPPPRQPAVRSYRVNASSQIKTVILLLNKTISGSGSDRL
jgi:hypothetical protein